LSLPETSKLYSFASLAQYPLGKRLIIRLADIIFYILIKFVGLTTRFEIEGSEHLGVITERGEVPIFAAWHDRIFLCTYVLRDHGIVVLTSQSFDGEYIARFLQRFGYGAIRGSSTRGGGKALVEMIRAMKRGIPMGFTLDGPKGPRHVAKSGALMLAKKTGNPVIAYSVEAAKFFTINSWDRLQLPLPWTKAKVYYAPPIYVSADANAKELENKLRELQAGIDILVEKGRRWREGL